MEPASNDYTDWSLVTDNEALLKREVRRFLPREKRHLLDELYSDVVVARWQSIMRTYDPQHPTRAKPLTHLVANVRWYAYKWVNRRRDCGESLMNDAASYTMDMIPRAEVISLLAQLPQESADILRWHYMNGNTLDEIAAHLEIPVKHVRARLATAMRLARESLHSDDDD